MSRSLPAGRRPAAALTVGMLLLAGCSGGGSTGPAQPPVSAFVQGTCRVLAPDVLQIGREVEHLGKGPEVDTTVLAKLTSAQTDLRQVAAGAEPGYQPALNQLVIAVGLVRLQARVGSYHPQQGDNLRNAYHSVVDVCTGKTPTPTATASPS